eukprot:Hpha_TRINITY_DN30228_c0_g1::TRINITY_DN30228_c0_g1_i1::g.27135::m.27135
MAGRQRLESDEVTFKDGDGDHVGIRSEVLGERGRVALLVGEPPDTAVHPQVPYVKRLAYAVSERTLYVNGHEAKIPVCNSINEEDLAVLLRRLEEVTRKGRAHWHSADVYDAAAELRALQEEQEEELREQGMSAEALAKLKERQEKDLKKKKKVPVESIEQLVAMGFSESRSKKALALCAGTTSEVALQWLEQHGDDPDIDEPLTEEQEPEWTRPLTAAEKEARLQAMQDQMAEKRKEREAHEQRAAIQREIKRREEGAKLAEVREEHERRQRMKLMEEKRREKEADARHKAEVRRKINEDRIAKGWAPLPEPEEKKKPAATAATDDAALQALLSSAAAPAAPAADDWDPWKGRVAAPTPAASAPAPAAPAAPLPLPDASTVPLPGHGVTEESLRQLATAVKAADTTGKCIQALLTYTGNACAQPFEIKFRTISLASKGFQNRVQSVPGAVELLYQIGFRPRAGDLYLASLHLPTLASASKVLGELK